MVSEHRWCWVNAVQRGATVRFAGCFPNQKFWSRGRSLADNRDMEGPRNWSNSQVIDGKAMARVLSRAPPEKQASTGPEFGQHLLETCSGAEIARWNGNNSDAMLIGPCTLLAAER